LQLQFFQFAMPSLRTSKQIIVGSEARTDINAQGSKASRLTSSGSDSQGTTNPFSDTNSQVSTLAVRQKNPLQNQYSLLALHQKQRGAKLKALSIDYDEIETSSEKFLSFGEYKHQARLLSPEQEVVRMLTREKLKLPSQSIMAPELSRASQRRAKPCQALRSLPRRVSAPTSSDRVACYAVQIYGFSGSTENEYFQISN